MITPNTTTTGTVVITTLETLDDEALVCCWSEQPQDDWGVVVVADMCTVVVTVITDVCCWSEQPQDDWVVIVDDMCIVDVCCTGLITHDVGLTVSVVASNIENSWSITNNAWKDIFTHSIY